MTLDAAPRLLDLFCGEGGAAKGYQAAGFHVTGVDRASLAARYPGTFVLGDALDYLAEHGHEFDVIHASPPCQGYSIGTAGNPVARARHPRLIPAVRALLELSGRPWVIENVNQARSQMVEPVLLCGRMFDLVALDTDGLPLVLDRHRLFESNLAIPQPAHPAHGSEQVAGVYGGASLAGIGSTPASDRWKARHQRHGGYVPRSTAVKQALLGIDWMTVKGMHESIPPAYATWVGHHLMRSLHVTSGVTA